METLLYKPLLSKEVIEVLLSAGVNYSIKNLEEKTPLEVVTAAVPTDFLKEETTRRERKKGKVFGSVAKFHAHYPYPIFESH